MVGVRIGCVYRRMWEHITVTQVQSCQQINIKSIILKIQHLVSGQNTMLPIMKIMSSYQSLHQSPGSSNGNFTVLMDVRRMSHVSTYGCHVRIYGCKDRWVWALCKYQQHMSHNKFNLYCYSINRTPWWLNQYTDTVLLKLSFVVLSITGT